jgi:hypothetical protein
MPAKAPRDCVSPDLCNVSNYKCNAIVLEISIIVLVSKKLSEEVIQNCLISSAVDTGK